MSYWVELHCDIARPGICRGERNNFPMGHVSSTRSRTMKGLKVIELEARKLGWRRLKDGRWACPECDRWLRT